MENNTLPRGIRNNNPLNLIISPNDWLGKVEHNNDGRFEQFTSLLYGIRAACINARTIIRRNKNCSVQDLINIWAPANENNTEAYITAVCKKANLSRFERLDPRNRNQMARLMWAMSYVENGQDISFQYFENAWALI